MLIFKDERHTWSGHNMFYMALLLSVIAIYGYLFLTREGERVKYAKMF